MPNYDVISNDYVICPMCNSDNTEVYDDWGTYMHRTCCVCNAEYTVYFERKYLGSNHGWERRH